MDAVDSGAFSVAITQIRLRWKAFAGQQVDEARDSSFWIEEGDAQADELFALRDLGNEVLGGGTHWIEARPKPMDTA